MCLGIPMKVLKIDGTLGIAEIGGVKRQISLQLLEQINEGDYVIVHAGFAIQKLDEIEAEETLKLLRQYSETIEHI